MQILDGRLNFVSTVQRIFVNKNGVGIIDIISSVS